MHDLTERIELAASQLGLREPFVAAVVSKIRREVVTGNPAFTASTNGTYLKFGAEWCAQWTQEQLFGLYFHEALHVILMHSWRREDRQPGLWNIATDAVINRMISAKGYQLPPGGVDIAWVTEAHDADEVYLRLMQEQNNKPKSGTGDPQGGWDEQGDLEDAPDEATKSDLEATVLAMAKMARDCGDKSTLIDRILGAVGKPSVRWQDELRVAMRSASRDDFTYRKFSRRFIGRKLYLPALYSDAMGGLAIGFDTSGSVSDVMALQLAAEIQGIVDDVNPDWVEVIYCDTKIGGTQRFERGEPVELKPVGGGGTRFRPVFDYLADRQSCGDKVAALVYLTDMEGNLDECEEPDFPVIWGNVGARDYDAPFGSVAKVRL